MFMNIAYDEVLTTTVSIVSRLVKADIELSADTDLLADVGMTSLQVMELVLEIEEEFDISFPLNRLPDIQTIKDLAQEIAASLDQ
ncbi:MAG: acyl carrier protein [Gammaproteobacteria bacterium]|nr:acyl carrier protein [Gammaproteobacteria bacterium]